jgi:hypothetical protein
MLDIYKTLRMVEDEISEMKRRQSSVLTAYQQQTREDIVKKFEQADHDLLEAAERKVRELNDLKHDTPYLITSARKVACVSVTRVKDEKDLKVTIDPIIYPTPFNLKFILNEPSVALYSPSSDKGTFSVNSVTHIHATDVIQALDLSDLDKLIELWITHKAEDSFVTKLKVMQQKVRNADSSAELLLESMLALSAPTSPRQLIYMCEDHDNEPTHKHEKIVPPSSVKGLLKHHLKL